MKLITYMDGHPRVGSAIDDRVVDLSQTFDSMLTLIEEGEPALGEARSIIAKSFRQ